MLFGQPSRPVSKRHPTAPQFSVPRPRGNCPPGTTNAVQQLSPLQSTMPAVHDGLVDGTNPQTPLIEHVCGYWHVPHEETVRVVPQLSVPDLAPQFFQIRLQNAVSPSYVQPHLFGVPPPPHVCPFGHVPQFTVIGKPQLSLSVTSPQFLPSRLQNAVSPSYVQPHLFGVPPPPHVCADEHVPQFTVRDVPQLLFAVKLSQFLLYCVQNAVSVSGTHGLHFPSTPHVTPVPLHTPHVYTLRYVPQLSGPVAMPQILPWREQ
jgi:hypothetical protein